MPRMPPPKLRVTRQHMSAADRAAFEEALTELIKELLRAAIVTPEKRHQLPAAPRASVDGQEKT